MLFQLQINDPSGEVRQLQLQPNQTLGRNEKVDILLKDPTVAPQVGSIFVSSNESDFWFKAAEGAPPIVLGDLQIREGNLPHEIPFRIGETRLTICAQKKDNPLPSFPSGVKPWKCSSNLGREMLWTARKAADTQLSIFLSGETGTGKEVLAHLIHSWSPRKAGPFVPLHCGALSLSLVESELFGHVKGAFTGAHHQRPGALMQAHGGTLFLDEIGDLPIDIQVKLLRFLEDGEIRPVGSDRIHRASVRLVCATHLPLEKLVEQGKFRRDLFYRLASITISIPSLRSRPEDIELLSRYFAEQNRKNLTKKAVLRLQAHSWPGNVRELQHTLERASGLSGEFQSILDEEAFQFMCKDDPLNPEKVLPPALSMKEIERHALLRALRLTHGNRAEAAILLGVARSTLFQMIKRHGIQGPRVVRDF
ncbi:MAG: sigma-54-dependent Fis family transcriptional regulator [Bdellovibrio sp.]|nr:sigma-54-dependent Fis family transcriptional regulator [Bdellovibrio sp.]